MTETANVTENEAEATAPATIEAPAPEPETEPAPAEPVPDAELATQLRELAGVLEADRAADGVRGDEQDVLMRVVTAELFRRISKTYAQHEARRTVDEAERMVIAMEKMAGAAERIAVSVENWTGIDTTGSWLNVGGALSLDPE